MTTSGNTTSQLLHRGLPSHLHWEPWQSHAMALASLHLCQRHGELPGVVRFGGPTLKDAQRHRRFNRSFCLIRLCEDIKQSDSLTTFNRARCFGPGLQSRC